MSSSDGGMLLSLNVTIISIMRRKIIKKTEHDCTAAFVSLLASNTEIPKNKQELGCMINLGVENNDLNRLKCKKQLNLIGNNQHKNVHRYIKNV